MAVCSLSRGHLKQLPSQDDRSCTIRLCTMCADICCVMAVVIHKYSICLLNVCCVAGAAPYCLQIGTCVGCWVFACAKRRIEHPVGIQGPCLQLEVTQCQTAQAEIWWTKCVLSSATDDSSSSSSSSSSTHLCQVPGAYMAANMV